MHRMEKCKTASRISFSLPSIQMLAKGRLLPHSAMMSMASSVDSDTALKVRRQAS